MPDLLPDALSWLDAKKHQAVAEIATAMANPAAGGSAIWGAVKDLLGNLGVPTGDQEQSTDPVENARQIMSGFGVGSIRAGGNPNLMLSHGAGINKFASFGEARNSLYSPSFALTGHQEVVNPFATEGRKGAAYLIPKEGAFDPALDTSTLFNRDAYTARKMQYPGMGGSPTERLADRFSRGDVRLLEGGGSLGDSEAAIGAYPLENPQRLAIQQSPAFRSFKDYETSPKGAATLTTDQARPKFMADMLQQMINSWQDKRGIAESMLRPSLQTFAAMGDTEAQAILRRAATLPSNYGELHVNGPVNITPEKFAGLIMVPSEETSGLAEKLAYQYSQKGLNSRVDYSGDIDPQYLFELAKELQQRAGPFAGRSL